jgi:hypothetical protein
MSQETGQIHDELRFRFELLAAAQFYAKLCYIDLARSWHGERTLVERLRMFWSADDKFVPLSDGWSSICQCDLSSLKISQWPVDSLISSHWAWSLGLSKHEILTANHWPFSLITVLALKSSNSQYQCNANVSFVLRSQSQCSVMQRPKLECPPAVRLPNCPIPWIMIESQSLVLSVLTWLPQTTW